MPEANNTNNIYKSSKLFRVISESVHLLLLYLSNMWGMARLLPEDTLADIVYYLRTVHICIINACSLTDGITVILKEKWENVYVPSASLSPPSFGVHRLFINLIIVL